jgi:hypothetical protein
MAGVQWVGQKLRTTSLAGVSAPLVVLRVDSFWLDVIWCKQMSVPTDNRDRWANLSKPPKLLPEKLLRQIKLLSKKRD